MRTVRKTMMVVAMVGLVSPAQAVEADVPSVTTHLREDGITEVRIASKDGAPIKTYEVNLSRHHAPATNAIATRKWESLKFGAFVCFNSNQFSGNEYCKISDPSIYNPTNLDVGSWVDAMTKAGMKHAILTTRHTSGFLLWHSATSDFGVASSGNKTDVVREFVDRCRQKNIVPGLYYCMWGGKAWMPHPAARAIIMAQLYELAKNYGDIHFFWIDMLGWGPFSGQEVYDLIKNLQPKAVVLISQAIQDGTKLRCFPTDAVNGEETLPPASGHNPMRKVGETSYYLPFDYEPISQTRPGKGSDPYNKGNSGTGRGCWFTYGEGKGFPPSRPIPPGQLAQSIKQAYRRGAANVMLSMAPDHSGSMRAADVEQLEALGKLLREPTQAALSQGCRVTASGVWENNPLFGPDKAVDDDSETRWGGGTGAKQGWLELDLGQSKRFDSVLIEEGWDRTQRFDIQIKENDQWRTILTGTTIGPSFSGRFPGVTARHVRLNIIEAKDVPTIWEFQLLESGAKK